MRKLRMIITSVVVIAIVGSSFAFNAKKIGKFCISGSLVRTTCDIITSDVKRISGTPNTNYVVDWDGTGCTSSNPIPCGTSAHFAAD
jgi:hypothetical protein